MPVAASKTSKVADNEIDLLADMEDAKQPDPVDEDFDLLSDMAESTATAWVPWNEDDQPNGVQGAVTHIGTVTQEAKYGGEDVPYVELQDKEGTVWGVRGYGTVLANQLQREIDNGLKNGDIIAVKNLGLTQNRAKTNEYRNFAVKTKRV